jgi:hypothetical protein
MYTPPLLPKEPCLSSSIDRTKYSLVRVRVEVRGRGRGRGRGRVRSRVRERGRGRGRGRPNPSPSPEPEPTNLSPRQVAHRRVGVPDVLTEGGRRADDTLLVRVRVSTK